MMQRQTMLMYSHRFVCGTQLSTIILRKEILLFLLERDLKKSEKYEGAYVKEPIPGKYDWVVSFDLNSLYPHLIMQYNISPETLLDTRHPYSGVDKILESRSYI